MLSKLLPGCTPFTKQRSSTAGLVDLVLAYYNILVDLVLAYYNI
jgi:hypothetical protein